MPIRDTNDAAILAMRGIHLYHYATSNCAMRIRLQLAEKRLPWIDHYVDLRKQENLTPAYFAIHPQGLVPSVVVDGTVVYESADILLFIEERFPQPSLLPADPALLPEMHDWLEFTRSRHLPAIKTWAYGRNRVPTKTRESMAAYRELQQDPALVAFHEETLSESGIPESKIKQAEQELRGVFARMEENLAHAPWILGDQVTLADIAWIPQYALLQRNDFPFREFPNVMQWIERWKARASYREAIARWMPSAA